MDAVYLTVMAKVCQQEVSQMTNDEHKRWSEPPPCRKFAKVKLESRKLKRKLATAYPRWWASGGSAKSC